MGTQMFCSKNKKNMYNPAYPSFTILGYKGVYISRTCFPDEGLYESMYNDTFFLIFFLKTELNSLLSVMNLNYLYDND